MNSLKPSIPISMPTKTIFTSIPIECLSSNITNEPGLKSCSDNFSFICTSTLPFYSISYGKNISLLQPSMTSVPESEANIPLLNVDPMTLSTQQRPLSSSSSSNYNNINNNNNNNIIITNNNNSNLSVNSSRIEDIDDDMVNLSSHIDQLFFTKHPLRLQPFGKS